MLFGKTHNIKPGEAAILTTANGDVEVVVLYLLPKGRVAVVNRRGYAGIRSLMKDKDKSWFDITLEELVKERVDLMIRFVKARNLRIKK